jgi:hypothetical protein
LRLAECERLEKGGWYAHCLNCPVYGPAPAL